MGKNNGDLFRTTLMGGYDKDDVSEGITRMKDENYAEKTRLLNTIKEKDKKIAELTEKLNQREQRIAVLEQDIRGKYQTYIDNYDSIARLVFEAQLRADTIIKDANERSEQILEQAQAAAQNCLESVQNEVDEKLSEGKKKYLAVQEELNSTVELINQVQRRIMESCREVHSIASTIPVFMQDLEDDMEEEIIEHRSLEKSALPVLEPEEESLDEEDEMY